MKRTCKITLLSLFLSLAILLGGPTKEIIAYDVRPVAGPPAPPTPVAAPVTVTTEEVLAAYITNVNQNVTKEEAEHMAGCITKEAERHDVDKTVLLAIAHTESTFYSGAVSETDYKGLMQTSDILAEEAGYEPEELFDPAVSIEVGAAYISEQLETFDEDMELALTAYNQGPGAVMAGDYTEEYARVTMERMEDIDRFLGDRL